MNEQDIMVSFKEENRGNDTGMVAFYNENALIPFGFISMDNLDNGVYFSDHILNEGQRGKAQRELKGEWVAFCPATGDKRLCLSP